MLYSILQEFEHTWGCGLLHGHDGGERERDERGAWGVGLLVAAAAASFFRPRPFVLYLRVLDLSAYTRLVTSAKKAAMYFFFEFYNSH